MSKSRAEVNSHRNPLRSWESEITPDYVVAHAARQVRRGKKPSIAFAGYLNPELALQVAQGRLASRAVRDPEEVLAIPFGSILEWTKIRQPERGIEWAAADLLTNASTEVRGRFIVELTLMYQDMNHASYDESEHLVLNNMATVAGYCGPEGREKLLSAWLDLSAAA